MNKSKKIKVALVGIGNCASSLVQGVSFYSRSENTTVGLMHPNFAGYNVSDIEFVAAFDVDKRKVGKDLAEAIFQEPNCTKKFQGVELLNIKVLKGHVLDGVALHMQEYFIVDDGQKPVDIAQELHKSGAEMLISYLPVGSAEASRFYANEAIKAEVGFINAIPEFICSDPAWIAKFKEKGIPCAGDDIKSQFGATILHRILTRVIEDRGHSIENTYQLNVGGNTDFLNMKDESRLISKRMSKTSAVMSILDNKEFGVRIGPSDYIPHLNDNKVCYINIKGKQFGNLSFELDLKLSVEDSPNSAGVMVDVIRVMKVALDRRISGNLEAVSAYYFKSPAVQHRDDVARKMVNDFEQSK
ncbi:MAG: inositol-3-phosphate synthase [Legionella sp.]|nr:MAG: inositol-3-phosphate synthase [Legionella sp.]